MTELPNLKNNLQVGNVMNSKVISTIILVLFIGSGVVTNSSGNPRDFSNIQDGETVRLNDGAQMYDERLGSIEDVDWWSMFHHDPQLTGHSTSISPMTNNVLWTHSTGFYLGGFCSPAVVDDRLYIGSSAFGYLYEDAMKLLDHIYGKEHLFRNNGHLFLNDLYRREESLRQDFGILYCLNALNGVELWYFYTQGYVISSPAVYDDKVYISSVDEYDWVGKIYCLDAATGDEIWNSPLYSPFSSPNVVEDKLYVSAIEIDGEDLIGKIFCLNMLDGSEIWNYTIGIGEYLFLSTPAVAYDNVYFITENETEGVPGHIYCLDADTGEIIWQSSMWSMLTSPVISYGKVYISSYDLINDRGILLCLDAEDGDEQWRYMMGVEELAGYSTPAIAYGNVYFSTISPVTFRAKVTCINASTGDYIWARTPGDMMMLSSPAVADEKVYISSYLFGNLYCFDYADGTTIWSYSFEFETLTSPAIASGILYTADASGTIYAFEDVLKIGDISGGFLSVKVEIQNRGDFDFTNVSWSISVVGGILGLIDRTDTGTISILEAGDSELVRVTPVFGLGMIRIIVTATMPGLNVIRRIREGFVFGPFVFIQENGGMNI